MAFFRKIMLGSTYIAACGFNPLRGSLKYTAESPEWRESQINRLKQIVAYAMESTVFYKAHYADFLEGVSVRDMPIDEFLDVFDKLPHLEKEHLRGNNVEKVRVPGVKGYLRKTSGTTGIPVKVYVDKNTLAQQLRTRWMFFAWHGIKPGDLEGRFWGRPSKRKFRDSVKDYILSRELFQFDGDDSILLKNMRRLENSKPVYFYGYPSLLMRYADAYDGSNRKKPQPKVIFSTAEMLNEAQRKYISDIFECPVYQEYGCSEVDIIAFECKNLCYHTNNNLFIQYKDSISKLYEIIITDISNICVPIIKYKMSDLVQKEKLNCTCIQGSSSFKCVKGRDIDRVISLTNGIEFHAVMLSNIFDSLVADGFDIFKFKIYHIEPDSFLILVDGRFLYEDKCSIERYIKKKFNELSSNFCRIKVNFQSISNSVNKMSYYEKVF